ncbi:MAG: hypothetical protein HUU29_12460 [Planctomycetaceae bacterium]|nr:hypothetical protein [Planctomycetaceae bacterium]
MASKSKMKRLRRKLEAQQLKAEIEARQAGAAGAQGVVAVVERAEALTAAQNRKTEEQTNVIPAEAGIQSREENIAEKNGNWTPASAGVTQASDGASSVSPSLSPCDFAALREKSSKLTPDKVDAILFNVYKLRLKGIETKVSAEPEEAKLTGPDMHVLRGIRKLAMKFGDIDEYDEVITTVLLIRVQAIEATLAKTPDYVLGNADVQAMTLLHRVVTERIKREEEQTEDMRRKTGVEEAPDATDVIPAKAGIQSPGANVAKSKDKNWIPASAGMTQAMNMPSSSSLGASAALRETSSFSDSGLPTFDSPTAKTASPVAAA